MNLPPAEVERIREQFREFAARSAEPLGNQMVASAGFRESLPESLADRINRQIAETSARLGPGAVCILCIAAANGSAELIDAKAQQVGVDRIEFTGWCRMRGATLTARVLTSSLSYMIGSADSPASTTESAPVGFHAILRFPN